MLEPKKTNAGQMNTNQRNKRGEARNCLSAKNTYARSLYNYCSPTAVCRHALTQQVTTANNTHTWGCQSNQATIASYLELPVRCLCLEEF